MEMGALSRSLVKQYSSFDETLSNLKPCITSAEPRSNKVDFFDFGVSFSADEVVELIASLYENFLKIGEAKDKQRQRDHGIYFTNRVLSDLIVKDAIDKLSYNDTPKFLEPAAGMGSFVFAYIRNMFTHIDQSKLHSHSSKQEILNSIFIVERDQTSAEILMWLINTYLAIKYDANLNFPASNLYFGDAIINHETGESEDLKKRFNLESPFDVVITNPPYRLLKAYHTDSEELRQEIAALKNLTSKVNYFDDISGVSNLYKMFVCKIFDELIDSGGVVGLVIPRSLLTDFQSIKLRKKLISSSEIYNIYDVPEGSPHFKGIGQAFSLFTLVKGGSTEYINLCTPDEKGNFSESAKRTRKPLDFYKNISDDMSLIPLSAEESIFLEKLSAYPRVRDCPQIVNLRGELDISIDKAFICEQKTPLYFIQGIDIGLFNLKHTSKFVSEDFLPRSKAKWIRNERIACQQISNVQQRRRLKWSLVPSKHILGNSCNFIAIDSDSIFQDKEPVLSSYLLAVFNSFFMNHWFKLLSYNNHISNNEIANMPLIIPDAKKQVEIDFIVRKLLIKYTHDLHVNLEKLLCEVFDVNLDASYIYPIRGRL